jgi:hypothetical protein
MQNEKRQNARHYQVIYGPFVTRDLADCFKAVGEIKVAQAAPFAGTLRW